MRNHLSNYSYPLPPELIAQSPLKQRDASRLLVVNRATRQINHHHFTDLPQLLPANALLVRNDTQVIPARLFGTKMTGGKCEVLLVRRVVNIATPLATASEVWECMTKPGLKPGQCVTFSGGLSATCQEVSSAVGFTRMLAFNRSGEAFRTALDTTGHTPIPPYIHSDLNEAELRERYQVLYAKHRGSVAAPTAGLHFTPAVDTALRAKGIEIAEVTLHVGLGTFAAPTAEQLAARRLHPEWFSLSETTAQAINAAKATGRPVVAVGTTTTRVLESVADEAGRVQATSGETTLMISPPYRFHCVDQLITNFHQPESSLLMLVSALCTQPQTADVFETFGKTLIGQAYAEAVRERYRFFSFGDSMLVV
jgi:S-adenosylmethionine:tRNA ribosyltransferase-isomerase